MNNKKSMVKLFLFILILTIMLSFTGCSRSGEKVVAYYDNDSLIYNGQTYYVVKPSGDAVLHYMKDRTLGVTEDGTSYVGSIEGDEENNYIYTSNRGGPGSDRTLYALDPDTVCYSGTVTGVYIRKNSVDEEYNDDASAIETVLSLPEVGGDTYFTYDTQSSASFSRSIYLCYENCPIATKAYGRVAYIDKRWVYVPQDEIDRSFEEYYDSDNMDDMEVTGAVISDESVISVLKEITG